MTGAKVAFDAASQNGGIKDRRVGLARREAALNEAIPQAVDMIEHDHAELLFGVSERLLPVLAVPPEIARRNMSLLVPPLGATSTADNVLFIHPGYDYEVVAVYSRLQQFSMWRIALITAAGFDPQLGMCLHDSIARGGATEPPDLYTLTGDPAELAACIIPARPTTVIVAGDTLTYATAGCVLAQQDWYDFLVGLSPVNPQVAHEILGPNCNDGMLLAQMVSSPASGVTKVAREYMTWIKQFLDEPPSAATLSGYIVAMYLVQAISVTGGKMTGVELRRTLQARVGVGGLILDFMRGNRGNEFVDLNYIQGTGG